MFVSGQVCQFLNQFRAIYGDLTNLAPIHSENDPSLQRIGGIVLTIAFFTPQEIRRFYGSSARGTGPRLERRHRRVSVVELLLNANSVSEAEGGSFNFLESNIDERLEHFDFFVDVHGNR